ncbi:Hypothetical predicted protein [Olea europaea subsp. europaea]|uniref:Uncharacterized protein n=1 Tax=Olea europaea subsp. europaea TaxID=158383 RepID=A0A8S0RJS5_OLEEU|nr:Hypothetical predicted protein [Olea europaea subsp. europaea]
MMKQKFHCFEQVDVSLSDGLVKDVGASTGSSPPGVRVADQQKMNYVVDSFPLQQQQSSAGSCLPEVLNYAPPMAAAFTKEFRSISKCKNCSSI